METRSVGEAPMSGCVHVAGMQMMHEDERHHLNMKKNDRMTETATDAATSHGRIGVLFIYYMGKKHCMNVPCACFKDTHRVSGMTQICMNTLTRSYFPTHV
jgi:hypothetical protein